MYLTTDYPLEIQAAKARALHIAMTRPSRAASVSAKLTSIYGARPEAWQQKKPLFITPSGDVPIGVIESMQRRHSEIWGRY